MYVGSQSVDMEGLAEVKNCLHCLESKTLENFYKDSRKKSGYRSICKKCYLARYPFKQTEQARRNWRAYKMSRKGTVTCLLNNAKDRAKRRNLEFSLDSDWVNHRLDAGHCEVSGIAFDLSDTDNAHRARPFSPSIDKIDSKGGYTENNSRLVCFCVNMAMSDWGQETFYFMCEKVLENRLK